MFHQWEEYKIGIWPHRFCKVCGAEQERELSVPSCPPPPWHPRPPACQQTDERFGFAFCAPVKVYRTSASGRVTDRMFRFDTRHQSPASAYLVALDDGSADWFFGRELEVGR
jgi:hypothetical protein